MSNSKIIKIKRSFFSYGEQEKAIEELQGNSFKGLTPVTMKSSPKLEVDLTYEEEDLLLPYIIDCDSNDREFRKKVTDYYHDITISIAKDGTPLEIGLKRSNLEPVSKDNLPINIVDYVQFKAVYKNPRLAKSKVLATGHPHVRFYIEDSESSLAQEKEIAESKDQALQIYFANKSNQKFISMALDLMVVNHKDKNTTEKELLFRKLAETKPVEFVRITTDKDAHLKHLISLAISANILKRVGQAVVWVESGETLGHTIDETVQYMKDKNNAPKVNVIKTQLRAE